MGSFAHTVHSNKAREIYHVDLNDHLTRWFIAEDRFIDRERKLSARWTREHPYEVWHSGAGATGGAGLVGTARTFKDAIAMAKSAPVPVGVHPADRLRRTR